MPPRASLRCLGFCGADDSVEPQLLHAISKQHEWVEWGVLFRTEKAGQPRYASDEWLKRLAAVNRRRVMRLAAHLCGTRVDELLRGDVAFVRRLHEEVGFGRVQINATSANGACVEAFGSDGGADECAAKLRAAFAQLPQVEFILQRNSETRPLWQRLLHEPSRNMSVLYDESMGLGISAASWPTPDEAVPFGFAGGLSPTNLQQELAKMDEIAAGRVIWVDMESSLRTELLDGRDIFDCNKAMLCVETVVAMGYQPGLDYAHDADGANKTDPSYVGTTDSDLADGADADAATRKKMKTS
uniref:Uncharacterized protein n=1 Tax=Chrysotila carterae TaxID=13221 RepID=A0A7S4BHZ9_CHRCT|mmetsp:Transcript_919/g.1852  ORF Transcript_919/g.1852 Transcript_919/m.1852 type:complete len:300 (+) Transcript_919:324-1223(+)